MNEEKDRNRMTNADVVLGPTNTEGYSCRNNKCCKEDEIGKSGWTL